MKIALFAKKTGDGFIEAFNFFMKELSLREFRISLYQPFYQDISRSFHFDTPFTLFSSCEELKSLSPDVFISFGGDGTILDALELIQDTLIPVLGVNFGRLGFLSATSAEEFGEALDQLLNKEYEIDSRALLRLTTEENPFATFNYALNEITILNSYPSKMLSIGVWIDDYFLNNYWGDGLIVATPTGSTAYSMSCGGNILTPSSKNLIITPIAPHNLSIRSLVISEDSKIKIRVHENRYDSYTIVLDSRTRKITKPVDIFIEKEKFDFNLVRLNGKEFFQTLRNKLLWGLDKRN
ncbi:MAG: NAD kinase [Bacteroidales bacterium]|nr:NAD kinase [Bacteroidales bacterium]